MAARESVSNTLSEEPSRKYAAIESLFEQLVDKVKTEIRDSTEKLLERGAISREQKENVMRTLNQNHLETDYAASLLFKAVLTNVEVDDRHFDRLLLALRDLEMDQLADDLQKASVVVMHSLSAQQMDKDRVNGDASHSARGTDTSVKKDGKELSHDSGIAPPSFSTSSSVPRHMEEYHAHYDQPKLVTNQAPLMSRNSTPPQPSQSVEESLATSSQGTILLEPAEDFATPVLSIAGDFQSQPTLHEPDPYDEGGPHSPPCAPIQAEDESNSMFLGGCYATIKDEVGGTSEELVDQLSEKLKALHLELKNKEMELQARVQEKKQNSELLARIKELEDKVKQMEDEIHMQKLRTDKVATEKDKEINSWKKLYEEKERKVEMLREKIARQEKEKRELIRDHMAKIRGLVVQQKESARLVSEYEGKIEYLDATLKQAIEEKEVAEQQLREANSKMELAEVKQLKAIFNLMKELRAKDKEWAMLKDANHKLEKEIMALEFENQKLVIITKEQVAVLHQKDKELAEERQAAAESRHELKSERQQSLKLQNENSQLKRQLSELQEKISAKESLAKRSKTD